MSRRAKARDPVREAKHADAYAERDLAMDAADENYEPGDCLACDGSGLEWDGMRCAACGANRDRESMNG